VFAQDFLQVPRKRGCFTHAHVHALHSDRPGLMGRVSSQPAMSLSELPAHPGLELHFGAPDNFPDRSLEPWHAFLYQFLHLSAHLRVSLGLIHHEHASILGRKFIRCSRHHHLKTPPASAARQRPQHIRGRIVEHDSNVAALLRVGVEFAHFDCYRPRETLVVDPQTFSFV